jgi:hypothetical protein
MKISQEEIAVAIAAYNANPLLPVGRKHLNAMRAALEAAYRVRKARKKAKAKAEAEAKRCGVYYKGKPLCELSPEEIAEFVTSAARPV